MTISITNQQTQKKLSDQDIKDWQHWISYSEKLKNLIIPKYTIDYRYSKRLDLHGKSITDAYSATCEFIIQQQLAGSKEIIIVTGKSGAISREFTSWLANIPQIATFIGIPDKRGEKFGSYRIFLKNQVKIGRS
jgi:DNA-nicking Smr family endonuclease